MIQLKDVKKSFGKANGEILAVDGVSLTIEEGEIFGIIGYSGAGKSTLIRLLNGLETPTTGTITIGSREISAFTVKSYGKQDKKSA